MALFEYERKNGIQLGTVGDECIECRKKHRGEEDYEPQSLDYQEVYKFWINNLSHCLCMDCFKESLNGYLLLNPNEFKEVVPDVQPEEKPKAKKNSKKKEVDKDGSKTAESSEGE